MIRAVTSLDKEGVIELIKLFHEEELHRFGYVFNYEKVAQDFDTAMKMPFVYAMVIENDGRIDGLIAAIISERFFLKGKAAQELMWYVRPEKRREGMKLFKQFEKGCKMQGCKEILMIGLEDTKAEKFYEKYGYKKLETSFLKKL